MLLRSGKVKRGLNPIRQSPAKRKKLIFHQAQSKIAILSNTNPLQPNPQLMLYRAEQSHITPPVEVSKCSNSIPFVERLPTEYWCQIYFSIAGRKIYIKPFLSRSLYGTNTDIGLQRSQCGTVLALESTCRWMYNTLIPIYYSKNIFFIPYCPHHFPTDIGPENVNLILSIEFHESFGAHMSKISWLQIAAMASLKEISVQYGSPCNWCDHTHSVEEI